MNTASYPAERLDRDRAALILVDHQVGLILGVEDPERELLRRNVIALTKVAQAYGLPVVITTSADNGPNGILLPEVSAELPDAPVVRRPGEIDAFDNADFAAAVKATGRNQLIVAGISTDVCVSFAAQSAVAAGYTTHAVLDASGTWNKLATQAAVSRMEKAGVVINNTVAVAAELQRDWREKGGQELAGLFAGHAIPFYGSLLPYVTPAA
ncbi:nicotinamidase-related amidase [Streptomyces sp. SAI-133]|uniref:isochorismatase family protein n=1 Tax=unclassified Streptomyces TaxID=2593676 RepID=UPI0024762A56|nr:isochorismatase family protein [Streptomyces sp. SAI-133]MDH6590026.1 nicotinamidase-related amidase [Streptomyces sp. SAI-133]